MDISIGQTSLKENENVNVKIVKTMWKFVQLNRQQWLVGFSLFRVIISGKLGATMNKWMVG